jgi:hypothetical protein
VSARTPIATAAELDGLDDAEVLEGYEAGREGWPEPGDNRSLSYWHGWRTGSADGNHRKLDQYDRLLAEDVIKTGWLKRRFAA